VVGFAVLLALAFVVRHHGGGLLARLAPAIHGR
jgi:hypothetical protein